MSSSVPPFQMEDQTDEDFFDKLVDDDDDDDVGGSQSVVVPTISGEIIIDDEVNEVGIVSEDEEESKSKDVILVSGNNNDTEKEILVSEESVSLVSSEISRGSGSKSLSIKEVEWNLFNADSTAQNGENRKGSYSDLFTDLGDSGADPFASLGDGDNLKGGFESTTAVKDNVVVSDSVSSSVSARYHDGQVNVASTEQATSGQDMYNSQYWENQYPGWRYDATTGQWIQVEGYDATANTQSSYAEQVQEVGNDFVSGQKSEVSYLQQTAQSVVGTVDEGCTTSSVSSWNQGQQVNDYPSHMVFDPQYPGWYYDTIAQEWRLLESYDPTIQSTSTVHNQHLQSGTTTSNGFSSEEHSLYNQGQVSNHMPQNLSSQNQGGNWAGSADKYAQENVKMWQPEAAANSDAIAGSTSGYAKQNANMWQPKAVAKADTSGSTGSYAQQNVSMWQPDAVSSSTSGYAKQNMNMWQPEAVAKADTGAGSTGSYAQQNVSMWQPDAVSKRDPVAGSTGSYSQQSTNMWQPEAVAKSDTVGGSAGSYAQQNMNMWLPKAVAKSDAVSGSMGSYGQQNMNMWQPEPVAKSDGVAGSMGGYAQQNVKMWQPEAVAKSDGVAGSTGGYAQQNMNMWQPEPVPKSWFGPGSAGSYAQQNVHTWHPEAVGNSYAASGFTDPKQIQKVYGSRDHLNNLQDQNVGLNPMGTNVVHEETHQSHGGNSVVTGFKSFHPYESSIQQLNQSGFDQSQQTLPMHDLDGNHKSGFHSTQPFQTAAQPFCNVNEGRSSAGRPPHALSVGSSISIVNIMDAVNEKNDATQIGLGVDYFRALCQQSYPGPLVGGSVGAKEVGKWIDERINKCESPYLDYREAEHMRLLLSLLKIASQHYGKLRSPFGTDPSLKENDRPEIAVARLFASARKNVTQLSGYGAIPRCLQNVPSEAQLLATAAEVQNLIVSGKRLEALQCAQEGQFWGFAFQLAADLGTQFFIDTARQMAHRMLVAGSPLKTLSLVMAGYQEDVFSGDRSNFTGSPGAVNMSQSHAQVGPSSVVDDWEENLATITANRTRDDERVLFTLGDFLWKHTGQITAAHMCYLIAEANFEACSDSARLCLIGADHIKFSRTYASPEAIQRTEFYEYSMVLGNSQSVLLPFQPYKLIYAYMLAEVGKLSDSLKYCQAILKSLKTGRAPEVDAWKQLASSLEDRIRIHQQSGFGTNLGAGKFVGKLLPFLDRSIHRMIGPPPPVPAGNGNEHDNHPVGQRVANSQSTMAMQSLMPSESMDPISAWTGGGSRTNMHNRSISEPDFGRSPRVDSSSEASSSHTQGKASDLGGPSRFGRIGSQIFQKTVGWVARRQDRQAKLGEKNNFYFDEKRKSWVERGAEPPAEEVAPPPPPTGAAFQNGGLDYNINNAFKGDSSPANGGAEMKSPPSSERSSGIPPIPPSSNQFSARGRMGVRSRYVDTFNQGTGSHVGFSSPSIAPTKPGGGANAKFFIPTPTSLVEETPDAIGGRMQEVASSQQDLSMLMSKDSFASPPAPAPAPSSSSMQRFPSMNNITPTRGKGMGVMDNGTSRRTASWSGSVTDAFSPPKVNEIKPLGEALGVSSSLMPSNPSATQMPMNGSSFADDLHEVEL
ncbi:hypothetical protein IFM89_027556 [Coptis chinensis]|uniref:Protein transport protein sec16 n=1 Tax=Coptis chinensis TaxID=261450 RepID=A0A835HQE3_9MAGN|nr:hypothetical protein IFM89_027556 [Coptis chinensis]